MDRLRTSFSIHRNYHRGHRGGSLGRKCVISEIYVVVGGNDPAGLPLFAGSFVIGGRWFCPSGIGIRIDRELIAELLVGLFCRASVFAG